MRKYAMQSANYRLISKEGLKKCMDQGVHMQLVNVLSPEYYHLGSIEGSVRIPVSELTERAHELDKRSVVVVYGATLECEASERAAEILADRGFRVKAYLGGIKEWKQAGYPTDFEYLRERGAA